MTFNPREPLPDDLWRLRRWRDRPQPKPQRGYGLEVTLVGLVTLQNLLLNLVLPEWSHGIANLAMAGVMVGVAYRAGITLDRMGLRHFRRGLRVGLVAVLIIGAIIAAGVAVPVTREFFADDRFSDLDTGDMLFEVLGRIPLVTALFEEVVFRGVLIGVFVARFSPLAAVSLSSALFGLWHVLPGLDTLESNPAGGFVESPLEIAGALVGGVIITAIAGYLFSWLRLRGNSLVTPFVAHLANNSFAFLGGWLVVTQGWV